MKNVFIPPASFSIPLLVIAIGLGWACYSIVLKNLNSKDIIFSFSAMAAAFAMFYLNISLSMKSEEKNFSVNTHAVLTEGLVLDVMSRGRKSSYIVTEREKLSQAVREELLIFAEAQKVHKGFDDGNYEKLLHATKYFYLNSFLGSMLVDFPDWQMREVSFKGGISKSFNYREDGAGENSFIATSELDSVMGNDKRGYSLDGAVTLARGLTLPPDTVVYKEDNSVVIDNPFLRMVVSVDVAGSFTYAGFKSTSSGSFALDYNKTSKTLSFFPNLNIKTVMKKERSGNPDYGLYIDWVNRLEVFMKEGFE